MSTDKKKKTSWSYEAAVATVKFPDGVTADFDTEEIHADCVQFLYHYGVKQFLSDKIAGIGKGATSTDKLEVFNDYFDLLVSGETKKAVSRTTTRKPTFVEFWEVIGGAEVVRQADAADMYGKLYPVKPKKTD